MSTFSQAYKDNIEQDIEFTMEEILAIEQEVSILELLVNQNGHNYNFDQRQVLVERAQKLADTHRKLCDEVFAKRQVLAYVKASIINDNQTHQTSSLH